MHDFRCASVTVVALCMIFCTIFDAMHDFDLQNGRKIMHTVHFVEEDF